MSNTVKHIESVVNEIKEAYSLGQNNCQLSIQGDNATITVEAPNYSSIKVVFDTNDVAELNGEELKSFILDKMVKVAEAFEAEDGLNDLQLDDYSTIEELASELNLTVFQLVEELGDDEKFFENFWRVAEMDI